MEREEEKERVSTKELEIENMQEFLLENQDIKLENLPRYEDLIKPEVKQEVKLDNLQEVNTLPFLEDRPKKKEEPPVKNVHQKRFKIALSCFAIIGVLMMALVLINGVSLALLNSEVKDNQKDINSLTQEVTELQEEYNLNNPLDDEADKIGYRLALPRNYPDNTADLTWFDKLSIFLMKLFG
ncbi:MAG: hypothetical protein IJ371_04650 [Clostridia bacterium]|nr:hypothetical protein [Clostridia bacterium]